MRDKLAPENLSSHFNVVFLPSPRDLVPLAAWCEGASWRVPSIDHYHRLEVTKDGANRSRGAGRRSRAQQRSAAGRAGSEEQGGVEIFARRSTAIVEGGAAMTMLGKAF